MKLPRPISTGLKILTIPLIAYAALYLTDAIFTLASPKIKSKSELTSIIEEEAEKRGLDPSKITGKLRSRYTTYCTRSEDGSIELVLGGAGATRRYVRHELTHVQHKDFEGSESGTLRGELEYWFFREPRAILGSF